MLNICNRSDRKFFLKTKNDEILNYLSAWRLIRIKYLEISLFAFVSVFFVSCYSNSAPGRRLFVVERQSGHLAVIDDESEITARISLKGNLRHASMVFDPDLRYGYIVARDGIVSKIDLINAKEVNTLKVSENAIGIAISQDGRYIAVASYQPGGVSIIATEDFTLKKNIPAQYKGGISRVTGMVDGVGNAFIFSLMEAGEIWILKRDGEEYFIKHKIPTRAEKPFDAFITPEGRYYVAGHFESDRASKVDLWYPQKGSEALSLRPAKSGNAPVKMAHMEAWAVAGDKIFVPVPGSLQISILSRDNFQYLKSIQLEAEPVYAMVHPSERELWVTVSGKDHDGLIYIYSTEDYRLMHKIKAGKRIYHMSFSPKGNRAYVSSNETNEFHIIQCSDYKIIKTIRLSSPSGIFGVWRAFQIGL